MPFSALSMVSVIQAHPAQRVYLASSLMPAWPGLLLELPGLLNSRRGCVQTGPRYNDGPGVESGSTGADSSQREASRPCRGQPGSLARGGERSIECASFHPHGPVFHLGDEARLRPRHQVVGFAPATASRTGWSVGGDADWGSGTGSG